MTTWIEGRIVGKTQWTRTLFSLHFEAPGFGPFVAGQFCRVGLPAGDEIIGRPYSLVNSPHDHVNEILVVEVKDGPLSPRLNALQIGDALAVQPSPNGFFSVSEVPSAQTLFCIATGTGLGPFLSILRTSDPWQKFAKVVLVHGVRTSPELIYGDLITSIKRERGGAFDCITLTSRDTPASMPSHARAHVPGRITTAFETGALERVAGATLDAHAHAMLCGNPQMVEDMIALMKARGLRKHRRREPGHFTTEIYWNL